MSNRVLFSVVGLLLISVFAANPASAIKVYINPSIQTGNHSPDGTYIEANGMQDVAGRVVSKLQARGFEARSGGWLDPWAAADDAYAWGANCFIALHTNACDNNDTGWHTCHGTETFYDLKSDGWYLPGSKDIGTRCLNKCVDKFGAWGRGYSRGLIGNDLGITAYWKLQYIDTTLVEGLFHDNYDDLQVLNSAAGKDAYAQAIFEAVCDHYGWSYTNATPEVYIEPRGQHSSYYSEDGDANWGNSAGWCNSFDATLTSGGSRYYPAAAANPSGRWIQVKPTLRVPGGTYQVDVAHYDNSNISTDIVVSITLTNCTAQFGELKNGSTGAFQFGRGCQWVNLGNIMLTAGQTQPTVRFTYSSGNVNDSTHRWNVEAFRFSLVSTPSTLTLYSLTGGATSGGGVKNAGDSVTAIAAPNPGYRFVSWTIGGINGTVVSTDASYTFTMPGQNYTLYANFAQVGTPVTATPCPAAGGTTAGSGGYAPGQSVTLTATANPGYTFTNWTSGGCGGTVVSINPSYNLTVSTTDIAFYANFAPNPHTLIVLANPAARGTVSGDSGVRTFGTSCTVTATPNAGQYFGGWSTNPDGTGVVSRNLTYTFNMPDSDYTLYANFTGFIWSDGFEGYSTSGTASLDANDSVGPNQSANGTGGNPWWGPSPANALVVASHDGIGPHGGSKTITNWAGNCLDYVNLAWRLNNGANLPGSFFVDWWFYDAKGQSNNLTGQYSYLADSVSLQNHKNISRTADYATPLPAHFADPGDFNGIISLGCAREVHNGWDYTRYQARVLGASGVPGQYGSNGWINLPKTRSMGWHHCRIIVGSAKANGHNDVSFYIDDMSNAQLTTDSVSSGGFNLLETQEMIAPLQSGDPYGYFAFYDDVTVATLPAVLDLSVSPSQFANTTATATFFGVGAVSYLLQVDNGAWVPAASPYVIDVRGLSYGSHTVRVKALDSWGNEGAIATAIFGVDRSSIRNWGVIGFYPWGSSSSDPAPGKFANDFFAPNSTEVTAYARNGLVYNGKSWFSYSSPSPIIDFDTIYGANKTYGVSYLFTYIINNGPAIPNAYLSCGSDDGIKVWANGALVWSNDIYRALAIDSDLSSSFAIPSGVSRLLIKATQGSSSEQVQARLCAPGRIEPAWLSQIAYASSDDSPPSGSISINGGKAYTSSPGVTLTLSAVDDLSGVIKMRLSNDNVTWSALETFAVSKPWTLSSGDGPKTVYVRFTDRVGNESAPINARIVLGPPAQSVEKVGDLWALGNGPVYLLSNKMVTASYDGAFWIEEADRTAALKVIWPGSVAKGHAVNLYGMLGLTDTQRVMTASAVEDLGVSSQVISPLGMIQRALGGGGLNTNTPGISGGVGLYNLGMLVRIAGNVTYSNSDDPQKKYFYVNDGSGLNDGSDHVGVKVICGSANPPTSGIVKVTGVVDAERSSGQVVPVLIVRDPAEINPL